MNNPQFNISNIKDDLLNGLIDEDYYNQYFGILQQLTDAPKILYSTFINILQSLPNNHNIYVYKMKENEKNIMAGNITIKIEKKIIHGGVKCGHIEDLVVDKKWRSKGIAQNLLNFAKVICREIGCYKIILDCHDDLQPFYKRNGFSLGGIMMRYNIL